MTSHRIPRMDEVSCNRKGWRRCVPFESLRTRLRPCRGRVPCGCRCCCWSNEPSGGASKSTSIPDRLIYAGWAAEQLNSHFIARAESSIAASSATRHLLWWVRLEFLPRVALCSRKIIGYRNNRVTESVFSYPSLKETYWP